MSERQYRVDYEDLSQQVHRMLKHMILVGELKSGQKLVQDELAERLGVSRTPLLSAFSKLEKEMLVEMIPRRGAFVKKYELKELIDIYEIRVRLEPLGASLAAVHATDDQVAELGHKCETFAQLAQTKDAGLKESDYEFHMYIMELSGNKLLYNIISSYSIIPIANFYGFFKEPSVSAREHQSLCAAIQARDSDAAQAQMFNHVENSRRHLVELLARQD